VNILYICREDLPTYRADVKVLIEDKLSMQCNLTLVAALKDGENQNSVKGNADYQVVNPSRKIRKLLGNKLAKVTAKLCRSIKLIFSNEYDFVIVRDNAFLAFFFIVLGKFKKYRSSFWLSILLGDLIKEDAIKRKKKSNYIYSCFYLFIESLAIKSANLLIAQSDEMKRMFESELKVSANVIAVPMGISELEINNFNLKKQTKPLSIGYLGAIESGRDIPFIIETLALLKNDSEFCNVTLKIIGGSEDQMALKNLQVLVSDKKLNDHVFFTGQLDRQDAWQELAECEVCVSYIPRNKVFDVSSPTKLVEYLALGNKVVANDIPDQKLLLERVGATGLCLSNQEAFVEAIKYQFRNTLSSESVNEIIKATLNERGYEALSSGLINKLAEINKS